MRQTKAVAGSGQYEALLSLTIWAGLFRQKLEILASPISYQKYKIRTFSLWRHLTTTSDPELPSTRIAKFEFERESELNSVCFSQMMPSEK